MSHRTMDAFWTHQIPDLQVRNGITDSNFWKSARQGLVAKVTNRPPVTAAPGKYSPSDREALLKNKNRKPQKPSFFFIVLIYYVLTQDRNSIPDPVKQESDRMTLNEKEGCFYVCPWRVSGFLKKPEPFQGMIHCFHQTARGPCEAENDTLWSTQASLT